MLGDDDSLEFRKALVQGITSNEIIELEVVNKEVLANTIDKKSIILDIKLRDEQGKDYIIEMQRGNFGMNEDKRFQFYPSQNTSSQVSQGQNYSSINETIEIVFTESVYGTKPINKYQMRDEDGNLLRNNLHTIFIISLPLIKLKENMKDEEIIIYVIQNGINSDIMKIANDKQKELINFMERKYNELVGSQFFSEARQAELNESIIRDQILEAERIAEARGEVRGEAKGEMNSNLKSVQALMNKLNMDIDQAMELLCYDLETKEKIKQLLQ